MFRTEREAGETSLASFFVAWHSLSECLMAVEPWWSGKSASAPLPNRSFLSYVIIAQLVAIGTTTVPKFAIVLVWCFRNRAESVVGQVGTIVQSFDGCSQHSLGGLDNA